MTLFDATVVVGGFIFGFAIVLAGGCATGTYYRAGEGLVGSWLTLGVSPWIFVARLLAVINHRAEALTNTAALIFRG